MLFQLDRRQVKRSPGRLRIVCRVLGVPRLWDVQGTLVWRTLQAGLEVNDDAGDPLRAVFPDGILPASDDRNRSSVLLFPQGDL